MEFRRHIHHIFRRIQRVKTWQLFIILILAGFLTATFLRLNSISMKQRYDAVIAADKENKDSDIANRLYDLQRFATAHMNASVGQFYLENMYNRHRQRAIEAAVNDSNPNGNVTAKAAEVCDPQFASWSTAYVQCFIDELNKYPSAPDIEKDVILPSTALYQHSYFSPLWSPDFAGFSLLFTLGVAAIIVVRFTHLGLLYILLKLRYKGIGS